MIGESEVVRYFAGIFHGVEDAGDPVSCRVRLEDGIIDPPSYMAKMALVLGGRFKWYKSHEKSGWQVYVRYKGISYSLEDWKNYSWSISAETGDAETVLGASELKKKIAGAAKRMGRIVAEYGSQRLRSGQFFILNNYPKIRNACYHFRYHIQSEQESRKKREASYRKPKAVEKLVDRLNESIASDTRIAVAGYAMVGLYFSSLEVLFDVMFAFGERQTEYVTFRRLSWAKRFKTVLPPSSTPELARLYQRLLALKQNYRDTIFHGLGGDESLLIPLPGAGLVPISYETLTRSIHFRPTMMDVEFALEALHLSDEFDAWLESTTPYSHHLEFARFGFPIPLYGERLDEVKDAMAGPRDFTEWLEEQATIEDYLREQY
jgi:hypothetical protein